MSFLLMNFLFLTTIANLSVVRKQCVVPSYFDNSIMVATAENENPQDAIFVDTGVEAKCEDGTKLIVFVMCQMKGNKPELITFPKYDMKNKTMCNGKLSPDLGYFLEDFPFLIALLATWPTLSALIFAKHLLCKSRSRLLKWRAKQINEVNAVRSTHTRIK